MKNILLIGIGGTGSEAVDILYKKINELGKKADNNVSAIVFDTDTGDVENIKNATPISMADNASVGTICDRIGREYIREWFPCDDSAIRSQEMIRGAAQWRKKSYLAFLNAMNKPSSRMAFLTALEKMTIDPNASCEIYVIASIAGGTGSGTFIPLALFVRRYLRRQLGKNPIINAMIALPDIFAESQTKDNKIKVYANAYSILRELNAINLVTRNYNEGRSINKKSPIRFRIGNPSEPNVGLLFDAGDPAFWTPEAAPFNQIFLLDRITGVNSVKAHNMVLANSLYTLICTEIGAKFDSEASNHELLRSQNNGSNAIYAGISTSQIVFPVESVLNYLAHKKTLDSCESEWLILHRAVEKKIAENEKNARDCGQRYVMEDGEYAKIFLNEYDNECQKDVKNTVIDIIDRDTTIYGKDGSPIGNGIDAYVEKLEEAINEKLNVNYNSQVIERAKEVVDGDTPVTADQVNASANDFVELVKKYYKKVVEEIRKGNRSFCESILSFDKDADLYVDHSIALVDNVLKNKKGKFVHPVSALVQLSRLRKILTTKLEELEGVEPWKEIKRGENNALLREELLKVSESDKNYRTSKSRYFNNLPFGDSLSERFVNVCKENGNVENFYKEKGKNGKSKECKSDYRIDLAVLVDDIEEIISNVNYAAAEQYKLIVFGKLAKDVDLLMEKYRGFFTRFEKEKEDLIEKTKSVKRIDCGRNDSVINVYSSEEEKDAILENIFKATGPQTEAEMIETNNIAGIGVYSAIYKAACAIRNKKEWNEKDKTAYASLFDSMVDAYRDSIRNSEAFAKLASCSVIEAIVESCGDFDYDTVNKKLKACFIFAQEIATPSIKISDKLNTELVEPSNIVVYMMSYDTAKYIKKNADLLRLPQTANQSNEDDVISSCAEEFVKRYAANENVRLVIVKDLPDTVLYCTGEIMDITPLKIEKFDELSEYNIYYRNYVQALELFKKRDTEMWNPHLGNNLHKRGYLPYMNPEMERICDEKMIKALIYGLAKGKITYDRGFVTSRVFSFRVDKDGVKEQIRTIEGNVINDKNIAKLVSWMRNEDDLVEAWSAEYDKFVKMELNTLPTPANDAEIKTLEAQLSRKEFMMWLRGRDSLQQSKLFNLKKVTGFGTGSSSVIDAPINILELAYLIKTSEESSLDCDDAERIIKVAYKTFLAYCKSRTPMDAASERFMQVYKQQLQHVYRAVADYVCTYNGTEYEAYFNQFATWLNSCGAFKDISTAFEAVDEKGEVQITENVTLASDSCLAPGGAASIINEKKDDKKSKKKVKEDETETTLDETENLTGEETQVQEETNTEVEAA